MENNEQSEQEVFQALNNTVSGLNQVVNGIHKIVNDAEGKYTPEQKKQFFDTVKKTNIQNLLGEVGQLMGDLEKIQKKY